MPEMTIILRTPAWPDLVDKAPGKVVHVTAPIEVTGLEGGMQSGAASVAIRIDLEDGTTIVAETSLALFTTAARALEAKYGGDLMAGKPEDHPED